MTRYHITRQEVGTAHGALAQERSSESEAYKRGCIKTQDIIILVLEGYKAQTLSGGRTYSYLYIHM